MEALGWCAHSLPEFEHRPEHIPSQVIYSGNATIAIFPDGKKVVSRPRGDDEYDKEVGLAMCIAKRVYGGRKELLEAVERATNQNKPEAPKVKKYWHWLSFIQQEAVKSAEIPTYLRPEWCMWKYAMDADLGCDYLLHGFIHGYGSDICKLCIYSKTSRGA